jgi:class 3 adenylate cyclase
MGDGVLAYFGYPRADEHHAERAVRAGLALVEAVAGLDTAAETASSSPWRSAGGEFAATARRAGATRAPVPRHRRHRQ